MLLLRVFHENNPDGSLLETGSTPLIRNTAAQQLGDIQRAHPDELFNLLARIVPYLQHRSWDVRTAAAKALGHVVDNAPPWCPDESGAEQAIDDKADEPSLANFKLSSVLQYGTKLLASGLTTDLDKLVAAQEPAQQLEFKKRTLPFRVGWFGQADLALIAKDMNLEMPVIKTESQKPQEIPTTPTENGLSKRQLNQLRRKQKLDAKSSVSRARGVVDLGMGDEAVDIKVDHDQVFSLKRENVDESAQIVADFKGVKDIVPQKTLIQDTVVSEWPFHKLCQVLLVNLFDPAWEYRHGAAMGLREVLRLHSSGAARALHRSRAQNDAANARWIDQLATYLCCVLALDRFGDYISDNVVAPIRESVGQTLGALLLHSSASMTVKIHDVLHQMIMQSVWEVCHGGMLGLKYFVAVKSDPSQISAHLDKVLEAALKGLGDVDDDVRAASAATLIPIAPNLVFLRPQTLPSLLRTVWTCLSDLGDDLSASTGSLMDLLAVLCGFPEVLEAMRQNALQDSSSSFSHLVPRLYPFLRHTITSVRAAVLRALGTFLQAPEPWADAHFVRLLFQNVFLERSLSNQQSSLALFLRVIKIVDLSSSDLDSIFSLALHPIGTPQNPFPVPLYLLVRPSGQLYGPAEGEPQAKRRKRVEIGHDVDGPMIAGDVDLVGSETLIRSRISSAVACGRLISPASLYTALHSQFSSTQLTAHLIVKESFENKAGSQSTETRDLLLETLETSQVYSDTLPYLRVVRSQCQNLLNAFRDFGGLSKLPNLAIVVQGEDGNGPSAFSVDDAEKLAHEEFERLKRTLTPSNRLVASKVLSDTRLAVIEAIDRARTVQVEREMRIRAAAAAALIAMREVPKKPSALIKGVMDSIKTEEMLDLQTISAASIASLLQYYSESQKRGPADKITGNLLSFYCMDTAETPEYDAREGVILSLHKEEDLKNVSAEYERQARAARCTRRGTKLVLDNLCTSFGPNLLEKCPILATRLDTLTQPIADERKYQEIVDAMSILRAIIGKVHPLLYPQISKSFPTIITHLQSPKSVLRYTAAKCLASICSILRVQGMSLVVEECLPLANANEAHRRQGVIELIYHLCRVMQDEILPFVIFLLVPVLGRMSDSDNEVRIIATTTFATLVKLVPLEAGISDPEGFPPKLLEGRDRERQFIRQMLDPKKVEPFKLPVAIKAELRSYQQEGVNWLAFLNKYSLHGILCDDMGLGKTLQTICIIASDHAAEETKRKSLIVCPPTLSGHWQQEIQQFAPFLSCLAFVGSAETRQSLLPRVGDTDIVITSYDVCRREIDHLAEHQWNYCVLDEGHLIKNPRAKISVAVKRLQSRHRLILSGTPIQNNVLELWSLFDFLMPGFLGAERVFLDRVAKPIAASRNAKSSSKEQEAGALAIEALHKQVLPFLLRRLKEEVLEDLPPKIIQNYYCDLSDLQRQLFNDFARKERQQLTAEVGAESKEAKQHIFQALQYMRKLCNSPALVMKEDHKQYSSTQAMLKKSNSSLTDPVHAPKLTALRDLLVDCGIGVESEETLPSVSQHRALIFFQMKEMLDIVATTVLGKLLPSVQYLRLDGGVEAAKRQAIVNRFNTDPSYDALLLTTSVGGLGLNLTGADTVIFVEHDWNPQKDMQAMDRAHRIGQKKVVNVYRLVTRGTLEEKILGLQRFKIDVASTVVNQQNAGLATMETDQILDLFNVSTDDATGPIASSTDVTDLGPGDGREEEMVDATTGQVKEKGKRGYLDEIGELWDEKAYEEEFDLGGFLRGMRV